MESDQGQALFDKFSALDPARENKQIADQYDIDLKPLEQIDPARVLHQVENAGPPPDITAPDAPVIIAPENGLRFADTITVSGTAEPGSTVIVYVDGDAFTEGTVADGEGSWSVDMDTSSLGSGSHDLTATATDESDNESDQSEAVTVTKIKSIARWTFDTADMSAPTANDVVGSADGQLTGSYSLQAGLVGDHSVGLSNSVVAAHLATDFLQVPVGAVPFGTSMTVTWRGKNIALAGSGAMTSFLSNSTANASGLVSNGFSIRYCNSSFLGIGWWCFANGSSGPKRRFNSNAPNGTGTHFYAATYDEATNPNWQFYIDGVALTATATSNNGTGKPLTAGPNDLLIGADWNNPASNQIFGVNGIMDDPRIYSLVLTAQEIADRYADPSIP